MSSDDKMLNGEAQIAALLRLAGRRPAVPDAMQARIRATVHDVWRGNVRRTRSVRVIQWTSLATAACLVVVFLLRVPAPTHSQPANAPRLVATVDLMSGAALLGPARLASASQIFTGATIETSPDATLALRWSRRGSLRVAGDSAVRFESQGQLALDRGAVYFDSSAAGQSVSIRTPFGIVRDVGTQFEVRLERDSMRVRVREGAVDLRHGKTRERATADTELAVSRNGVIERRAISRSGPEWEWVVKAAPPIALTGSARDVLGAVAREKGLTLAFADSRAQQLAATTSLHSTVPVSPDEALVALNAATPLVCRIDGEALLIKRR